MDENVSDDDNDILPVFALRADDIMKKRQEAYEEMLKKVEKEDTANAAENAENDLLVKIHEKLKKKPRGKQKTGLKSAPKKVEKKIEPVRRSNRRRKKPLDEEVSQDIESKDVEESPINLPAAAKKRLLQIELENKRERKRIDTLNKRILSSCFTAADDENTSMIIETEQNITLKISYLSDISKLTVCEHEKFSTIISKIADLLKLNVTEIALWLRDESIGLDDTPLSLNVKPWDIIDCIPYKPCEEAENDTDSYKLLIKMQSNDSKKKIDIYAHKLEKFQGIMERYANLRSLPLKDLVFEFDGEKINSTDTPDVLDMESGSCVDVKVVGDSFKATPPAILCVDLEKEEPSHKMLDICVLD